MARFVPHTMLDHLVAQQFLAPRVERDKDLVRDAARRLAPDAKTWMTAHDERVRPAHALMDGQTIPANLRYKMLDPTGYIPSGRHETHTPPAPRGKTYLTRKPRDTTLPIHLHINCRCESVDVPQAVARTILSSPAVSVRGNRAFAEVSCSFPRASESEYGTAEDKAAAFMRGAIREVAEATGGGLGT